jgi:hypothetical protein
MHRGGRRINKKMVSVSTSVGFGVLEKNNNYFIDCDWISVEGEPAEPSENKNQRILNWIW